MTKLANVSIKGKPEPAKTNRKTQFAGKSAADLLEISLGISALLQVFVSDEETSLPNDDDNYNISCVIALQRAINEEIYSRIPFSQQFQAGGVK